MSNAWLEIEDQDRRRKYIRNRVARSILDKCVIGMFIALALAAIFAVALQIAGAE